MKKPFGLKIEVLLEFIDNDICADRLIISLKHQFRDIQLIENYETFYRFQLNSNGSAGKLFGWLEEMVII